MVVWRYYHRVVLCINNWTSRIDILLFSIRMWADNCYHLSIMHFILLVVVYCDKVSRWLLMCMLVHVRRPENAVGVRQIQGFILLWSYRLCSQQNEMKRIRKDSPFLCSSSYGPTSIAYTSPSHGVPLFLSLPAAAAFVVISENLFQGTWLCAFVMFD